MKCPYFRGIPYSQVAFEIAGATRKLNCTCEYGQCAYCTAGTLRTRNISYTGKWRHLAQYHVLQFILLHEQVKLQRRTKGAHKVTTQFSYEIKFRALPMMYEKVRN